MEQQSDERRGRLVVLAGLPRPSGVLQGRISRQPLRVRRRVRYTGHRRLRLRVPVRGREPAAQRRRVHLSVRLQARARRQIVHM